MSGDCRSNKFREETAEFSNEGSALGRRVERCTAPSKVRHDSSVERCERGYSESGSKIEVCNTEKIVPVQTNNVTFIKPDLKARTHLRSERPLAELWKELLHLQQRLTGVRESLTESMAESHKINDRLERTRERQHKAAARLFECGESVPEPDFKAPSLLQESYLNALMTCSRIVQTSDNADRKILELTDLRDQLSIDMKYTMSEIDRLTANPVDSDCSATDAEFRRAA